MSLDPTNLSALQGTMQVFILKGELAAAKDHMEFMLTSAEAVGVSAELIFLQVCFISSNVGAFPRGPVTIRPTCHPCMCRPCLHGERTKTATTT